MKTICPNCSYKNKGKEEKSNQALHVDLNPSSIHSNRSPKTSSTSKKSLINQIHNWQISIILFFREIQNLTHSRQANAGLTLFLISERK